MDLSEGSDDNEADGGGGGFAMRLIVARGSGDVGLRGRFFEGFAGAVSFAWETWSV